MPITVCIVDDDAGIRESVAAFIAGDSRFKCVGAFATGEEALAAIPTLKPGVVLMDINLPGISGSQCVQQLKAKVPQLQAMMLTVYENSDRVFEALAAGANGYLLKSTPPARLLEAILDLQNGGAPMSSHIARKVVRAFHPGPTNAPLAEQLAPREQEVLNLLARGCKYKEIATQLNLSVATIRTYICSIYNKLHVNCRTDAVVKYLATSNSSPYAGSLLHQDRGESKVLKS